VGWQETLGIKKRQHKKKSGVHKAGDAVDDVTGCFDGCLGGCGIMIVPLAVLGAALFAGAQKLRTSGD
jgi:hypothetical protein